MRLLCGEAKHLGMITAIALTLLASAAWASGGGKERGDWHIHNQSEAQVIVSIKTSDGTNCLNSYLDPLHTLGLPAELHHCPYPVVATIKTMQAGQTAGCEVTVEEMHDITFTGEKCE